jgi:TatD DNase family protein
VNLHYIDIHSHLSLSPLFENQEVILAKVREMGVGTITVGTDMKTSQMAIEIAEQNPELCWATVGFHPCDGFVLNHNTDWENLEQLARHEKVVAIGETGLDYFRDQSEELKIQQTWIFKKHIELAIRINKPLMLHVRASKGTDDAYYDALEILKQYPSPLRGAPLKEGAVHSAFESGSHIGELSEGWRGTDVRANFHFFSGSKQCMQDIIAAGFTVSVDGPITFSRDYDDMIKACPLESIMIETDAPFAAPAPYRGKTCEPWM